MNALLVRPVAAHTDNDPLNKTDPTGMRPGDCEMSVANSMAAEAARNPSEAGSLNKRLQENRDYWSNTTGEHDACILSYDSKGDGRIVESFGNLQAASYIAVVIDGTGQTMGNFSARPHATALRDASDGMAGFGSTATIGWLDFDSPGGPIAPLAGVDPGPAADGAGRLANFAAKLRRSYGGKRIVVVGHSYGSVVAGIAMRNLAAHDAIVTGSPGILADSAGETGFGGHLYVGNAKGDNRVGTSVGPFDPLGPSPAGFSDARILDTGSASGHNQYYDGRSLCSIASVVTNRVEVMGSAGGRDLWGYSRCHG